MPPHPATFLRDLADYAGDVASDKNMQGELFDRLQGRIADLLGKPTLYFFSGKLGFPGRKDSSSPLTD